MSLPSAVVRLYPPRPTFAAIMAGLAPVAWWRLGEPAGAATAAPAAGAWPGNYAGAPALGAAGLIEGDSDTAFGGDGIDAYCNVPGPIALPLVGWSLAAWVRITPAQAATGANYILAGASVRPLLAVYEWGAGTFGVQASWRDSTATVRTVTSPGGTMPADGLPHLIAATHDGATLRLYVDGAMVTSSATWDAAAYAAQAWYIGRFGAVYWPAGAVIDEPAIWNRALTAAELGDLYAAGAGIDSGTPLECNVLRGVIRHGRDDPNSQPEADAATLELVGVLPPEVEVGTALAVVAQFGGVDYPRFAGRISDVAIGWDSIDVPIATVIATGELADMGRRIIGDAPYPLETDGARVNRAIAAAEVATDAVRSDPGVLSVLPRDVDAQPALVVASDAAVDGNGFVWQATDGAVLYADAAHRRAALVAFELDACDLPASLVWAKGLVGLANDARVRWGTPEAEVRETDPESVAALGTFAASLTTRLATEADATNRATYIIARQAWPSWVLAGLEFALEAPHISPADTAALLDLEVHALLSITGMPAGAPATSALVFVEGWTETIEAGAWSLDLAVSDYCRTAPAPTWDQTDPAWQWDTLDPGWSWDSTTCLPPYVGRGRWADVPASQRWDQTDPGITWDTWQA
jgi:hypothetical protein